ncbi:glucose-1-phosphate thymidylyltransferase [archaeon]|nr:MAG: glucose-1-phosphate thymidylyltransferase [archaeon]RLG66091.1 MAG: glucose-1-phosphate thymidylyltransferase [archaeon]HDM23387.1 glucose-1-phosphate thymidylyltransferase [Candidatus Bathyarchaeota archaeon]
MINEAVILAAGQGVRMRPLTDELPKPCLPVAGKPIIHIILEELNKIGIEKVVIVTHYMENVLKETINGKAKSLGMSVEYARQEGILGTADALVRASEKLESDKFIVYYADIIVSSDMLRNIMHAHPDNCTCTLAVTEVDDPTKFGVVKVDREMNVVDIVEKPSFSDVKTIFAGIYVGTSSLIDYARETEPSPRGEKEITTAFLKAIKTGKIVKAFCIPFESWIHIGYPWDLLYANERLMKKFTGRKPMIKGKVEKRVMLRGFVYVGENTIIRSGAYIEGPVWIGDNCDIGPNCYIRPFTCIYDNCRIGNACEIKNSIIFEGSHIAHLSYVGDSIIGRDCNLGAGTITANLRFDDKTVKVNIKGEIIDSGRRKLGVIMGHHVKTGINVSLMPGVKVGSRSWIYPHIVIYRDIPSNAKVKSDVLP